MTVAEGFPCPRCGGARVADVAAHALRCGACGDFAPLAPGEAQERRWSELRAARAPADAVVCGGCGAGFAYARAGECPLCERPFVAVADGDVEEPVGLAPFDVAKADAEAAAGRFLAPRWGPAPPGVARALYVAVWTFHFRSLAVFDGQRGDHVRDGERTVTQWSAVSSAVGREVTNAWVPGFRGPAGARFDGWDFTRVVPYRPELLAGHVAARPALDLAQAWARCRQEATRDLRGDALAWIGGDEQRLTKLSAGFGEPVVGLLSFPVWVVTTGAGPGARTAWVHGQSGEVIGQRPPASPLLPALAAAAAGLGALGCGAWWWS